MKLASSEQLCFVIFICFFHLHLSYQTKPNVLVVIVDDLRPSLGAYGDVKARTPNIDKLAEKSFVFTQAFAQQALCAPSRNSFLTSRRPDSLHLYDFYSYWRYFVGNFTTLPQVFKENGYYTQSIGKVFHPGVSSNFTDDALYSWSGTPYHPPTEAFKESRVCVNPDGGLARNLLCPVIVEGQPGSSLPDLESLRAASDFLKYRRNTTGGLPYFLAVGFHKPHVPLKFPIEYLRYHSLQNFTLPQNHWRPSLLPTVAWNPWSDLRERDDIAALNIPFPYGPMPDSMSLKIIQHYYSAVTYIDDLIGQLLQQIDDNTIVVLMGDHGWSMSEHGEFSKFSNFEMATKVPLIMHVPGLNNRKITLSNLVELVDVFPTLVDLTQVTNSLETCLEDGTNDKLCTEGRSLLPMMSSSLKKQENPTKKAIFTQYPRPSQFPSPDSDRPKLKQIKIMGYSIKTPRYRYANWVYFNRTTFKPDWNRSFGAELYDHLIDPEENLNLITRPEMIYVKNILQKKLILGWRYA